MAVRSSGTWRGGVGAALGVALTAALGCGDPPSVEAGEDAPPPLREVREDPTDSPIEGIDEGTLATFELGDALFNHAYRDAQGLGPLYVHRSCATCHEDDGRGPGAVRRLATSGAPLPFGDAVRPRLSAGATVPVVPPEGRDDVREAPRLGPATFGRGYMEAIPDATILGWEEAQAGRDDGISGRAHRVEVSAERPEDGRAGQLGRFGHKARIASLAEFVADALVADMGLTSSIRPHELPNPEGLEDDLREGIDVGDDELAAITLYVRLLAIPRRAPADAEGARLFEEARCAVCHVPAARTRPDHPDAVLADVDAPLYTDLLLHDMGEGLADGIAEQQASGREWRTAPLIGLRHLRGLLHDGRAATALEAIRAHASEGSEANDSVARFEALSAGDRATLLRFVEGL